MDKVYVLVNRNDALLYYGAFFNKKDAQEWANTYNAIQKFGKTHKGYAKVEVLFTIKDKGTVNGEV